MKVKFGALITDGRGKIGGHVASKNRGGAYLRTKVTPVNPQTSFQDTARARITTFSQGWRALTQAQRTSWNSAVNDFSKTDIFGDIKNPSGLNLYVRLNSNLSEIGASAIALPPLPGTAENVIGLSVTASESTPSLDLFWTGSDPASDVTWVIRASPQVSPGVSFIKSKLRNVALATSADVGTIDIVAAYVARFGTLILGQQIFIEVIAINESTGIKSSPVSASCLVAA